LPSVTASSTSYVFPAVLEYAEVTAIIEIVKSRLTIFRAGIPAWEMLIILIFLRSLGVVALLAKQRAVYLHLISQSKQK
jgi:hypothetical protein